MIQKKVCMLGTFAVGKTSLVQRFVTSMFSDKYHTTIGVKVDKKRVDYGQQEVDLILWDIHGEDEFQKIRMSYLRGMSGYLLVADGTRSLTLEQAKRLQETVQTSMGKVPFVLVLNKADLKEEWELDEGVVAECIRQGWLVTTTSAKSGQGVEEAFTALVQRMLDP